jgi:transaldolase
MKFFFDTVNLNEFHEAHVIGILDGVKTNHSILAKEGKGFKEAILEMCKIVNGPVNAEVIATDCPTMLKEGHEYVTWHKNIVVKLPTTREGIKACKSFSDEGIKTNMTLCFSPTQALMCAKAGAAYVSPFVGRLDDISDNCMDLVRQIVQIYKN